jgi:hypothetical protein
MKAQLARLTVFAAAFVLLCSGVFVVNQTAQVVTLANTVSPAFGQVVLIGLLIIYAVIILVPIVMIIRLPRALHPPADDSSPEFRDYLGKLGKRLATNPHLAGLNARLDDRPGIEAALKALNRKADTIIKSAASTVFVSTAISQNGRLDALMVLAAQTRLVWQLAHLYYQRPSLADMVRLYANIGATVFLVSELDDMDISEQVEPVIASALAGSAASVVPGATVVATLITQSILDGAANAFLTLRIGVIAQQYCGSLTSVSRKSARRYASVAAAGMLGAIVGASAKVVSKAILGAAKKAGVGTVGTAAGGLRRVGNWLNPFKRPAPTIDGED